MTRSLHSRMMWVGRASKALVFAVVIALAVGVLGLAAPAQAAPFAVDSTADAVDANTGDGVCATAGGACTLRAAIQQANALAGADEISVPAGTYTLSIPNNKDQFGSDVPEDQSAKGDLDIRSNVTIDGAGAGSTTVNGGDLDRIFDVVFNTGAAAEISGLTITNGNVQTSDDGGGISVGSGTSLVLEDSIVTGNTVFFRGGGIKNFGALTMTNTAVDDNEATNGTGGGIMNVGTVTMTGSSVDDNKAPNFGVGGGIHNLDDINDPNFTASVTMTNSTVNGNSALNATGGAGRGGGIENKDGDLTITDSTVSNNTATNIAGGIYNFSGDLTVTGSTVSGNSAARFGGGILSETHPNLTEEATTIRNSTISGNSVTGTGAQSVGGGVHNNQGRTVVENTTVTNNTAPANQGGGVASATTNPGSPTVRTEVHSTIVSANTGTDVDTVFHTDSSFDSNGYNLIGDGNATGAFNQSGDLTNVTDPKLGPLADNGGPTRTHALLTGSQAIDAGNTACPPPATDQRGVSRPQNGDGVGTARCDIGSFEVEPTLSINDVTVKEGKTGTTDAVFTVSLSAPSSAQVTVDYLTADGSAKAPADYTTTSGQLVFDPDQTTRTVTVPVRGDKKVERSEFFFVNLSDAANASIADGQGKGTIRNDDRRRRR